MVRPMRPHVLVTGAAGFIGSHLVDALCTDGLAVRSLVRPGEDLTHLRGSDSHVVHGDLKESDSLDRAMAGIDTVYHLGAISRYDLNVPDAEYEAVNVAGTRNILVAASKAGAKRVVFTATIEAVGTSKDGKPLTEDSPQAPRNVYGRSKLEAENLMRTYHAEHGLHTVVVRPPMTYGPREPILCQRLFRMVQRGLYPLIGDGKALTEFCYVKNQVHGIRLAAERGRAGEVYFISDERSYSIEEIVRAIADECGVRVLTPHLPVSLALAVGLGFELASKVLRFYPFVIPQTGRPPFSRKTVEWTSESRLFCDITKARGELGYRPAYSLREGVAETVEWYRQHGMMK